MRYSKKGVTLVELIICCAIIVMVGGACTAILMSGQTIFNKSTSSAAAQLDTDVIQTYFTNLLPRTSDFAQIDLSDAQSKTTGMCLYFDTADNFIIRTSGKDVIIESVADFTYRLVCAGQTGYARPQFIYTVTMKDGSSYTSGYVLCNLKFQDEISDALKTNGSARSNPIYFAGTATVPADNS